MLAAPAEVYGRASEGEPKRAGPRFHIPSSAESATRTGSAADRGTAADASVTPAWR